MKTRNVLIGLAVLLLGAGVAWAAGAVGGLNIFRGHFRLTSHHGETITCGTASTGDGSLCIEGPLETNGALDVASDVTVTGNDIAFGNGGTISNATNGAITFGEASEDEINTFTSNTLTVTSSTGVTSKVYSSINLTAPIVATGLVTIRFCGNLPGSGTATTSFISPVPEATVLSGVANYEFGGTGCDGEDNATVGTADEVVTAVTMTPVAIKCAAICTGGSAANDAMVFTVTDDGTAVTGGPTCTATLAGDATLAQCANSGQTAGATAIAGNSAIAVKMVSTDDDCDDAGDDVECFVTFATN